MFDYGKLKIQIRSYLNFEDILHVWLLTSTILKFGANFTLTLRMLTLMKAGTKHIVPYVFHKKPHIKSAFVFYIIMNNLDPNVQFSSIITRQMKEKRGL